MRRAPARVLVLAYHYPPVGGAGVQRTTAFCRLLGEHGYEPVVVTGRGARGRWTPEDRSLAAGLDHRIHRVELPEPTSSDGVRLGDRLARLGLMHGRWANWVDRRSARRGARRAARGRRGRDLREHVAVRVGSGGRPPERRGGRPVDRRPARSLGARRDDRLPLGAAPSAGPGTHGPRARIGDAVVVMNTPGAAAAAIARVPGASPRHVDPERLRPRRLRRAAAAAVTTACCGSCTPATCTRRSDSDTARGARRGAAASASRSTSCPAATSSCSRRSRACRPAVRDSVELHLAGSLRAADEIAISRRRRRTACASYGYLGHAASVELVRGADLLFCPMHDLPAGGQRADRARARPTSTSRRGARSSRRCRRATRATSRARPAPAVSVRPDRRGRRCGRSSATSSRRCAAAASRRRSISDLLQRYARPQLAAALARLLDDVTHAAARSDASRRGRRRGRSRRTEHMRARTLVAVARSLGGHRRRAVPRRRRVGFQSFTAGRAGCSATSIGREAPPSRSSSCAGSRDGRERSRWPRRRPAAERGCA